MLLNELSVNIHRRDAQKASDNDAQLASYLEKVLSPASADFATAHWKTLLSGLAHDPALFPSAADAPRGGKARFTASTAPAVLARLTDFERRTGFQRGAILQAAWALTLAQHQTREDVVFAVAEGALTFPQRARASPDARLIAIIGALQQAQFLGGERARIGFKRILEQSESGSLQVQSLLVLTDGSDLGERNDFPIIISVNTTDTINVTVESDPAIPNAKVKVLLNHLLQALEAVVASDEHTTVADVEVISPAEKALLLEKSTPAHSAREDLVHRLFERQAALTPDNIAVEEETGHTMSYAELDAAATLLAHQLPCGPGAIVPVCVDRSISLVVGLLAVLKSGAAYVVLDPEYPLERLRFIVEDTQAPFVLTIAKYADRFSNPLLAFENMMEDELDEDIDDVSVAVSPKDAAYIIYTSGSTGHPKGVILEHGAATSGLLSQPRSDGVRSLLFYNPVFSAAQRTIFGTLTSGGCLCIASKESLAVALSTVVTQMAVNTIGVTSSTAALLSADAAQSLKRITLTGEKVTQEVVDAWADKLDARSGYGLSEVTQLNWTASLKPGRSPNNIGRPADTTASYVLLPETLRLAPLLVPGELCLSGPQLAREYLNRPEQTAKVFVDNPFVPGRMYRTGDRAVCLEDGSIEILGRIDMQVKIAGQRLEPGEVAVVLREHASVETAAVVAVELQGETSLVACVVLASAAGPWGKKLENDLREHARSVLPSFAVPSFWHILDRLPTNHNGKVDIPGLRNKLKGLGREGLIRHSLPSNDADEDTGNLTPAEQVLRQVWAAVLELDDSLIGPSSSFLALGGSSIRAIQVATECREKGWNVAVSDIIRSASLRDLAGLVQVQVTAVIPYEPFSLLNGASVDGVSLEDYQDVYPSSPLQEALVAATLSGNSDYVYQRPYDIRGVDLARLKSAVQTVFGQNDILRTTFLSNGSTFVQAVVKPGVLPWEEHSSSLKEFLAVDAKRSVALGEPFIRLAVLPASSLLVVSAHHALFDYWSNAFLLDDAAAVYNGRPSETRTPYSSFIRHFLATESEGSQKFWKEYLDGASPSRMGVTPSDHKHVVERKVQVDAKSFLSTHSLTSGSVIYAAWALVLAAQTVSSEAVFATTLSGRDVPVDRVEAMGGPTLTTVPQRIAVDRTQTAADYVRAVQEGFWNMNRHSQYGLRGALRAAGQSSTLFDTMVNLLVQKDASPETQEIFRPYSDKPAWNTEFTTLEAIVEEDDVYFFRLNSDLDPTRAAFILDQFVNAVQGIIAQPASQLSDIQLMGKAEHQHLMELSAPVPSPSQKEFMHSLFDKMAAEAPDSVAIHWEDTESLSITYSELNSRANCLAAILQEHGVGPEVVVPLCLEKSVSTIVAILGVLKSGGAYAPLDHENPPERNNFIVGEVEAKIVLTERAHAEVFSETGAKVLCIDELDLSGSWPNVTSDATPDNLAYVLYTSGSTGLPKGVLIPHSAISTAMHSIVDFEGCHAGSRILQFSNYVFDVSISDIFTALNTGATLCLAPTSALLSDLAGCINAMRADHVFLTPTVAKLISPEDVPDVTKLILGGEALPPDLLAAWAPRLSLMNGYGPTEAAVFVVMASVPPRGNNRVIGKPLKTVSAAVLEVDSLQFTPFGAVGELCVSGPQLARGYLKRPENNAKAFVEYRGERLYRTGDLVRWLPDGQLECFGRKDSQVKISGHRIELGEIEQAILVTGKVVDCLVKVVELQGKKHLVAFTVFDASQTSQDIFLAPGAYADEIVSVSIGLSTLPPYMVPKIWVPCARFPLMPSGKANSRKLVQMVEALDPLEVSRYTSGGGEEAGEFVEPETDEEKLVQELWSSILGIESAAIGSNASFFTFGGDSISAIGLVGKCRKAGYSLAVGDVLAFPVLRDMAGRLKPISDGAQVVKSAPVYPISADVYWELRLHGVEREDIETIVPSGPGQSEFRVLADYEEQFWQLQAVRSIPPELDITRWLELTTRLTEINAILRTMYLRDAQGTYLQVVLKKPVLDFETLQLQDDSEMERVIEEDWKQVFSLGQPFIRYRLLVLPDGRRFLVTKADHGSYDGTLLRIFDAQFTALARGQPIEEPVRFHSFVNHIRCLDRSQPLGFWTRLLRGSSFSYPPTVSRPSISRMLLLKLDRKVDAFASQCGVTVPIVLQTAFTVLLARLSGMNDVTYDNLVTGRDLDMPEDTQQINGCCANFVPFRSSFDARTTVRELLKETQTLFWQTTENGTVSLSEIYSELDLPREQHANKCLFLFQPFEPASGPVDHMRWVVMALSKVRQPMNYALMLEVFKSAVGYNLRLRYDPRVYSAKDVDVMGENLLAIVEGMMAHSRSRVQEVMGNSD